MKSAINKRFLVNDCIIFSATRNDDGDNVYFASLVKNVVRTQSGNRLFVSNNNVSLSHNDMCLFDSVLSNVEDKDYVSRQFFETASDSERIYMWTLRADDSVLIVKKSSNLPTIDYTSSMTETEFRSLLTLWDIKKIKAVSEIQNFLGDIVVRQIEIGE
jgi:hypothetical protein